LRKSVLGDESAVLRRNRARSAAGPDRDQHSDPKAYVFSMPAIRPAKLFKYGALGAVVGIIAINALYLQPVRHPAPFFAKKIKPESSTKPSRAKQQAFKSSMPARNGDGKRQKKLAQTTDASLKSRSASHTLAVPPLRTATFERLFEGEKTPTGATRHPGPARDLIGALIKGKQGPVPRPPGNIPARSYKARDAGLTSLAGQSKDRIAAVQKALVKLGYPLEIDGIAGPATRAALVDFQHTNRLSSTGPARKRTLQVLAARARVRIP